MDHDTKNMGSDSLLLVATVATHQISRWLRTQVVGYKKIVTEAKHGEQAQATAMARRDLSLLAYAKHMASTTCSDAARVMFTVYVKLEWERLKGANRPLVVKPGKRKPQNDN